MLILARAFRWDPTSIKQMPCSQRHRFVKMHEESMRQENAAARGQTAPAVTSVPTGLSPNQPTTTPGKAVNLNYRGV